MWKIIYNYIGVRYESFSSNKVNEDSFISNKIGLILETEMHARMLVKKANLERQRKIIDNAMKFEE